MEKSEHSPALKLMLVEPIVPEGATMLAYTAPGVKDMTEGVARACRAVEWAEAGPPWVPRVFAAVTRDLATGMCESRSGLDADRKQTRRNCGANFPACLTLRMPSWLSPNG